MGADFLIDEYIRYEYEDGTKKYAYKGRKERVDIYEGSRSNPDFDSDTETFENFQRRHVLRRVIGACSRYRDKLVFADAAWRMALVDGKQQRYEQRGRELYGDAPVSRITKICRWWARSYAEVVGEGNSLQVGVGWQAVRF